MLLLLGVSAIAATTERSAQERDSKQVFWNKFKNSVIAGNKQAVAGLTKFPLEMSYGVPKIKNRNEFLRRYREVFSQQSNAAQCFAQAKPETEAGKPAQFIVACPDAAGNPVVIYRFNLTHWGWRLVALDNLNE
jgi:hypothetical protein